MSNDTKYREGIAAAVESAGPGFTEYLAERGYTPEQITLGLLKVYAKEFREKQHLERVNRRAYARGLPE